MTLGERIAGLRKQKKMSQEELAVAMDVSRQAVSKWENGLCNPDTENLIRLAGIFGVDVNVLVSNDLENSQDSYTSPSKRSNGIIALLSLLLVITTGAAIVFAVLWQAALCVPSDPQPDALESIETTKATEPTHWESIRMYINQGTLRTEIPLSAQEQTELANTIWRFTYSERPDQSGGEILYGGLNIEVEFTNENVTYTWSFTTREIQLRIRTNPDEDKIHRYLADNNLLTWLETFI